MKINISKVNNFAVLFLRIRSNFEYIYLLKWEKTKGDPVGKNDEKLSKFNIHGKYFKYRK